jgi:GTP pyrophosphokinase
MKNCNVGFGHLHDIMAFRIITTDIANCYRVLGIINSNYNMIPGSFKDYISTPKENNYQSLHFSSLGPQNKKIEIQIRTQEMHKTAEMGIAAHWSYKEKGNNEEGKKYEWMRELITLFEQADSSEVMRDYNIDMHNDQVFCFTPSGDIFNLPIGASIVDFAYAIHSEVGNSCISAKINGSTMPLNHRLNNGDQVEIMTDKESNPSPNWMQFVTTSKARASIRNFIRSKKRSEYIALGRAILNKFFAANNLEINEKLLEGILPNFNKKSIDDLYTFVAEGLVSRNEILKAVYPDQQKEAIVKKDQNATEREDWFAKIPNINSIPVEGLIYGMAINFAACCNPIPGDNITGVINTGSGVTIHNKTCLTLKSIALNPQKLVDICWRAGNDLDFYQSRIMVVMRNASGSLAEVSSNIARQKININNIKINNRANDFFEVIIDINVKNTDHLEEIMSTLRMSKTIVEVHRFY